LRRRIEGAIRDTLVRQRDPDALLVDVAGMRARMDREHHTDVIWEVKHLRGGLVDIDFIAQYLQLRHAHDHPAILSTNTRTALKAIRDAGLIDPGAADQMIDGLGLWQGLQGMLRLTIEGYLRKDPAADIPAALRDTLAAISGCAEFGVLEDKMRVTATVVHGHFRDLIEIPAAALTDEAANKN
jgi:glutamate-ammonia-ligase adenylyltransferase